MTRFWDALSIGAYPRPKKVCSLPKIVQTGRKGKYFALSAVQATWSIHCSREQDEKNDGQTSFSGHEQCQ